MSSILRACLPPTATGRALVNMCKTECALWQGHSQCKLWLFLGTGAHLGEGQMWFSQDFFGVPPSLQPCSHPACSAGCRKRSWGHLLLREPACHTGTSLQATIRSAGIPKRNAVNSAVHEVEVYAADLVRAVQETALRLCPWLGRCVPFLLS